MFSVSVRSVSGLGFGYTDLQGRFYTEPVGDQGGDQRVSACVVLVSGQCVCSVQCSVFVLVLVSG